MPRVQTDSTSPPNTLVVLAVGPSKTRVRRGSLPDWVIAFFLLLPNVALLIWFTYRPLIESLRLSFQRWDMISPDRLSVGWQNYTDWFRDPVSRKAMWNTGVFTVSTVILTLVGGLAFALVLNKRRFGSRLAGSALFAPYVVPGSVVAIGWYFIFDPKFGLLAAGFRAVGISSPNWYNRPGWAMVMVILVHTWKFLGYTCVLFLAGLQSIPPELFEAAEVDGASWWGSLRHVVLPGVRPTTVFVAVTSFLASMQAFDLVFVMTQGGPLDGTRTLSYQIFDEAFVRFRVGTASAVSTVLFVVLFVVTLIQVRLMDVRRAK